MAQIENKIQISFSFDDFPLVPFSYSPFLCISKKKERKVIIPRGRRKFMVRRTSGSCRKTSNMRRNNCTLDVQHTHDGWPARGSKIKLNSLGRNRLSLKIYIHTFSSFFFFLKLFNSTSRKAEKIQPVPFWILEALFPSVRLDIKGISPENKRKKRGK